MIYVLERVKTEPPKVPRASPGGQRIYMRVQVRMGAWVSHTHPAVLVSAVWTPPLIFSGVKVISVEPISAPSRCPSHKSRTISSPDKCWGLQVIRLHQDQCDQTAYTPLSDTVTKATARQQAWHLQSAEVIIWGFLMHLDSMLRGNFLTFSRLVI